MEGGEKNTVLMYTLQERIWHWVQALMIIILLLSGFHMHYPKSFPVFGDLATAVKVHTAMAFVLLANAFLGFFYQLSTGGIRQYIPMPQDFTRGAIAQARYYMYGIFKGEPHPYEKSPDKRLNPLQKITYFFLLTVLLPFQIVTGLLCWGSTTWPHTFEKLGGLKVLAPLHTLGAYFFLAFLVSHIYLTTTGDTPLQYIKAMITGVEER